MVALFKIVKTLDGASLPAPFVRGWSESDTLKVVRDYCIRYCNFDCEIIRMNDGKVVHTHIAQYYKGMA